MYNLFQDKNHHSGYKSKIYLYASNMTHTQNKKIKKIVRKDVKIYTK